MYRDQFKDIALTYIFVLIYALNLKINGAISFVYTRKQWLNLGILDEACIARPETCGAAGGSVAFWVRINHDRAGGIVSSSKYDYSASHFRITSSTELRYTTLLKSINHKQDKHRESLS